MATTKKPVDPAVVAAGHRLRTMRTTQKLSQKEVSDRTRGQLTTQQISRIEKGQVDGPTMLDLVLFGQVYGMTPNEMAAMFGYWQAAEDTKAAGDDPIVIEIRQKLRSLTGRTRRKFVHELEFALHEVSSE